MNLNQLYSKKVMDHFLNPRNMGELPDADVTVRVGNPVCGDVMEMALKIDKRRVSKRVQPSEGLNPQEDTEEFVENIKFKTLGCGAAIATSSIATELIKGKSLEEAEKLTNQSLTEALDGLPPAKLHCSLLATEAVQKAIKKYREGSK